jgi:hypothetical protein
MVDENSNQTGSINLNRIKKLKKEISNLKSKLSETKKQVLEKEDTFLEKHPGVLHPVSTIRREGKQVLRKAEEFKQHVNPPSEGPWFILVKYRKDNTWELQGTYYTEWERDNAVNDIKSKIHGRRGSYSEYYVTSDAREVHRFLKVSRYRESKHQAELRKEISRLPSGRWTENIQRGTQIEQPKQVSKTLEQYSGYSGRPSPMIPTMSIGAWGSFAQPKSTNLPEFGGTPPRTKQKMKTVIPHDQYRELLNSGYTREQLDENGIFDKFSKYYTEESVFPGTVPYRPISMNQSFLRVDLPKSPFQQRQEKGVPYEFYKPGLVGAVDPWTGERKTNYRPRRIFL